MRIDYRTEVFQSGLSTHLRLVKKPEQGASWEFLCHGERFGKECWKVVRQVRIWPRRGAFGCRHCASNIVSVHDLYDKQTGKWRVAPDDIGPALLAYAADLVPASDLGLQQVLAAMIDRVPLNGATEPKE